MEYCGQRLESDGEGAEAEKEGRPGQKCPDRTWRVYGGEFAWTRSFCAVYAALLVNRIVCRNAVLC